MSDKVSDVGIRIGWGALSGAVLTFCNAPGLQRSCGKTFGFSTTEFLPALIMILIGAALGALYGWGAARQRKW